MLAIILNRSLIGHRRKALKPIFLRHNMLLFQREGVTVFVEAGYSTAGTISIYRTVKIG